MDASERHDRSRQILTLLARGDAPHDIIDRHPGLTAEDVRRAAAEGLAALERGGAPRVETREERIARLRERHPRAFEPWSEDEDARLLLRFGEGARVAELAEALGRPEGGIRRRLERHLGPEWAQPAPGRADAPPNG